MDKTLFQYLLRLGDGDLILAQRLGALIGRDLTPWTRGEPVTAGPQSAPAPAQAPAATPA